MKYYSEITKKMYDSVRELEKAEKEVNDKNNARREDAMKVERAEKALVEARENYSKALNEFCAKHGPYHKTVDREEAARTWSNLSNLIDLLNL